MDSQTTDYEFYGLDFTDPGWKNDTTGGASELQTNGAEAGNIAGWNSTNSISGINGSAFGRFGGIVLQAGGTYLFDF